MSDADAQDADEVQSLKAQLTELKSKTQWLMDRAEISDLLSAYARGIDHGDSNLLKQFYHEGSIDEHGIFSGSGDDFAEWTTASGGNPRRFFRMMQHHHTTVSMDIRDNDAEVETYFFCVCTKHDNGLEFSSGRVADRFVKRDGRWGMLARQVIMDWTWSVPAATPSQSDGKYVRGQLDPEDVSRTLLPRLPNGGFHPSRPWRYL